MHWINWSKFKKPKECCCWEEQGITCNYCGNARIEFAVNQTIRHCAKIAGLKALDVLMGEDHPLLTETKKAFLNK